MLPTLVSSPLRARLYSMIRLRPVSFVIAKTAPPRRFEARGSSVSVEELCSSIRTADNAPLFVGAAWLSSVVTPPSATSGRIPSATLLNRLTIVSLP
jgi:hypothetical protein